MLKSVKVPKELEEIFSETEVQVKDYFDRLSFSPEDGTISIDGERYILVRAASMSVNFLNFITSMYPVLDDEEAIMASSKLLFDMAKSFGISDAQSFHSATNITDPMIRSSTGPIHFSYTGWSNVEILPGSVGAPDENFYLLYDHPHSFEAESWIKMDKKTDFCTCFMSAGYSSGWCQESFGIPLKAQEIMCRSKGDRACRFIMSQPHRLEEFVEKYKNENKDLF